MSQSDPLNRQLELARRDLLELSTQNRLLATARDQTRGASVEVKDEVSAEIFRMLVTEGKELQFEQGEEVEESSTKRRRTKKRSKKRETDKTTDALLHTELEPEELDRRLRLLVHDSNASFEEKGINVLFLAMGFLRWVEADKPDRPRDAPLLLIPCTLERTKAGSRYMLRYNGDEIETNLTLQIRMKVDFGIDLPKVPQVEDLSPTVYFQDVAAAVGERDGWDVRYDDMVVWFFSFTKLLMYRDLDPESWPADKPLQDRPLIRALMHDGFKPVQPLCGESESIDPIFEPAQTSHVIDCDSSQSLVIEEACRGRSLVIQGPPGTGKSQTITNLIASAVAAGKTILFVAEKMAALEVVKRRLDNIGIGDMCLELHSKKANKRVVLQEIDRTLKLGTPNIPDELSTTVRKLKERRDQLNEHVRELHTPLEPTGRTPYEVLSELIELRAAGTSLPDFQLAEAAGWSDEQYEKNLEAVTDLSEVMADLGSPLEHPWRGSQLDQILPLDLERLLVATPKQIELLDALTESSRSLAQRLNDDPPVNLDEVGRLLRTGGALLAAPDLDPQPMNGTMWSDHRKAIRELADSARAIVQAKTELGDKVTDAAWDADYAKARQAYGQHGQSWFRMFRSDYRAARRMLKDALLEPQPNTYEERLAIIDLLYARQKAVKDLSEIGTLGEKAFGRFWLDKKTDWKRVIAWEEWDTQTAASGVSPRFRSMLSLLEEPNQIEAGIEDLTARTERFLKGFEALSDSLKIDFAAAFGDGSKQAATSARDVKSDPIGSAIAKYAPTDTTPLVKLRERILSWERNPEGLQHWQTYRRSRAGAAAIGNGVLVERIDAGEIDPDQAPAMFRFACAEGMLRDMLEKMPGLETFDSAKYEQLIDEFCELDIARLELARAEVARAHWDGIGRRRGGNIGEAVALLKHEMQKKRRHLPLRQLLNRAGEAIQAVKPVFMMSPLSVAQFLKPGGLEFDMLLIDEASQVRPVEALGAAARCRQMVCVGDDKQMPPTQFFGVVIGDVNLDDGESPAMQAGDVESALGLCIARNMPQRMLRWHYRSKHESLIAVSNKEFYDNQLYVIPSPDRGGELGVKWHYIENGMFDNGKNLVEAKVVAEAIMRHAKERPEWTLGVGAFSVSQRDAILKELEDLRSEDSSCEAFFDPAAPDPFFVKNLENIQGDERDVIFVSCGYGPNESGRVNLNFGPVSASGGERRLNVLMTRAKRVCEIFSSMKAEDIDTTRATGRGPAAFRAYLKFAQMGAHVDGAKAGQAKDAFVENLQKQLGECGYEVQTHVGIAGVFIDLAIVDPDNEGRYLLGIDVDGESYRAGRSARDRDRSRMGVLNAQGWNIYRVWILDWFKRPNESLNELVEAIEAVRRGKRLKGGHGLASTVYDVDRQIGGPDPLSTAVADALPVPDRDDRQSGVQSDRPGDDDGFSMSDVLGTAIKVGGAVITAKEGKGLDAAIRVLVGKDDE